MHAERPAFIKNQYEFAANIRDPERNVAPRDVEDRRMNLYRELFYNNVEDFMAGNFPVIREMTDDDRWHSMIRDYFSRHLAHTPYFPRMPEEFVRYLQTERSDCEGDPAFLVELAHYEWMELALSISDDEPEWDRYDRNTDLLEQSPSVSPLATALSYLYPVHQIDTDHQPTEPGKLPTYIIIYRNREDDVHFMEINAPIFRLLQLLQEGNSITGRQALEQVAAEMKHPDPAVVISGGQEILRDLLEHDIILGTPRH